MRATAENYKATFYAVANGYKPISQADKLSYEDRRSQDFKALDLNNGNIYLIKHYDAWQIVERPDGSLIHIRPEPKLLFTYEQAKREAERLADNKFSDVPDRKTLSAGAGF